MAAEHASHYFLIIIISSTFRLEVPNSLNFDKSSFKTLFNFNWFLKTSIIKFWENLIFKTKFLLIIISFLMAGAEPAQPALLSKQFILIVISRAPPPPIYNYLAPRCEGYLRIFYRVYR